MKPQKFNKYAENMHKTIKRRIKSIVLSLCQRFDFFFFADANYTSNFIDLKSCFGNSHFAHNIYGKLMSKNLSVFGSFIEHHFLLVILANFTVNTLVRHFHTCGKI